MTVHSWSVLEIIRQGTTRKYAIDSRLICLPSRVMRVFFRASEWILQRNKRARATISVAEDVF